MKKILIFFITFILVFSITGCKSAAEKQMEKQMKDAGIDGSVDIDSGSVTMDNGQGGKVEIGGNQEWPDFMPREVPVFEDCEVFAATEMGNDKMVTISYNSEEDMEKYLKKFDNDGWKAQYEVIDNDIGEGIVIYEKEKYIVSIIYMSGDANITVGDADDEKSSLTQYKPYFKDAVSDEEDNSSIDLNNAEWPEDAPISEPDWFYDAQITGVISNDNGTIVTYEGVTRSEAADLINTYVNNRYCENISHTEDDDMEIYTGKWNGAIFTIEYDYGDFSIMWEK